MEEENEKFLVKAINFVSYRPRSRYETKQYLKRRKAEDEVISQVLAKLEELNFIDDQKFASWWLEQRLRFRPKGTALIRSELKQKGIASEVIEKTLSNAGGTEAETERAKELLAKKLPSWAGLPPDKRWQKAAGFLLRRGFPGQIVWSLVDRKQGRQ
jgi:regulatory protein